MVSETPFSYSTQKVNYSQFLTDLKSNKVLQSHPYKGLSLADDWNIIIQILSNNMPQHLMISAASVILPLQF